jgi:hypothetical protein
MKKPEKLAKNGVLTPFLAIFDFFLLFPYFSLLSPFDPFLGPFFRKKCHF